MSRHCRCGQIVPDQNRSTFQKRTPDVYKRQILQFASRIADSKVAKVASKGTKENPFIAKAVYSTDGLQTILKYAFEVSNRCV